MKLLVELLRTAIVLMQRNNTAGAIKVLTQVIAHLEQYRCVGL